MRWLINDIKNALAQLRRWQTWLIIGLICLFALLAYLIGNFAFMTDSVLTSFRQTASACREMTNGVIIFMFCGMIFFLFTGLLTLGEFQQHFHYKQYGARHQARRALIWAIGFALFTIALAIAALIFFNSYCR
ncbi:MAG: hypothetical protein ACD_10C00071G0004 [uncultured bacterium]|nr:MAG: hypothetical protein ACD_10C00071G0004 [uncultured bacterium]